MSSRTFIGGDAGRAALSLALALGLLGGCASTAQAVRDCPTEAWWWPGGSIAGAMNDPITWAVSLGVGPAALGVCTAVNQVKSAVKPSATGVYFDGPAVAQWCPQPESAGDERCPAREENTP
jgi:hypothetical protein